MFVVTLRKYIGKGLSAFPNSGVVSEAVKTLISKKTQTTEFFGTGFFKKPNSEFRYDVYKIDDLKKFKNEKSILDEELQQIRNIKNESYENSGMTIVNELFVYDSLDLIPDVYIKNLLNPELDYYQQILDRIHM